MLVNTVLWRIIMVAGTIWLNTLALNLKGIIVSIKILAFHSEK